MSVTKIAAQACPRCGCHAVVHDACDCGACQWSNCANCGRDASQPAGQGGADLFVAPAVTRCDLGAVEHEHLRGTIEHQHVRRAHRGYVFSVAGA